MPAPLRSHAGFGVTNMLKQRSTIAEAITRADGCGPAPSVPGVILLEPVSQHPECNSEAIRILSYPGQQKGRQQIDVLVASKILAPLRRRFSASDEYFVTEIKSGRRRYRCTRYLLNTHGPQAAQVVAILLERTSSPRLV